MNALHENAVEDRPATADGFDVKELERRNYFPTMIFQGEVEGSEAFNQDLLASMYAEFDRANAGEGVHEREAKSWRSARNLHRNPEFDLLKQGLQSALALVSSELRYSEEHYLRLSAMWFNINPPGSGNRAECRPGNLWSGCYCVQVPKGTGGMKFIDPRTISIMNPPKYEKGHRPKDGLTKIEFKPRPGHLVIFPAWLYHEVDPNMAQAEGRAGDYVYVSFNVVQARK